MLLTQGVRKQQWQQQQQQQQQQQLNQAAANIVVFLTEPLLCYRYHAPKRTYELMAAFDASHMSVHSSSSIKPRDEQQQQQELQQKGSRASSSATAAAATTADKQQSKRPCNNSAAAQQLPGSADIFTIVIVNQVQEKVFFKVRSSTTFKKVFVLYERRMGAPVRHDGWLYYRFLYNGHRLFHEWTPSDVGMVDGDSIDAMHPQGG
jgi:hypothetical protein